MFPKAGMKIKVHNRLLVLYCTYIMSGYVRMYMHIHTLGLVLAGLFTISSENVINRGCDKEIQV